MPIRSLLSQTSFNPDQTEMIAKAFDDAWAQLGDEADPAMASLVRTALAKRIIETAQRPGIDPQKLRDDAIAYVKNNPLWPSPSYVDIRPEGHPSPRPKSHRGNVSTLQVSDLDRAVRILAFDEPRGLHRAMAALASLAQIQRKF